MAIDPIERLNEWHSAIFLAVFAVVWIATFIFECFARHGLDVGVDSILLATIPVAIAGRILISRAKGIE